MDVLSLYERMKIDKDAEVSPSNFVNIERGDASTRFRRTTTIK